MTDRRRAQEQAERAVADAILETALDCIISIDARGCVIEWNPAAERTFGYARAEALGKELAVLIIPPELREAHRRGLARYLATGEAPVLGRRVEVPALHADGTSFPVELAITRLPADPPRFIAYLRDITARVRAEKLRGMRSAVIQYLAEPVTLEEAAPRVLGAICEALDWDNAGFWRPDESGDVLECIATWQRSGSPAAVFAKGSAGGRFRRGEGLPGRVWAAARREWVRDVRTDRGFPRRELASQAGLQSAFACPVLFAGRELGVIEFFTRSVREPDAEVDETICNVAAQLGQFIERRSAAASLLESENRFRALMEQAPFSVQIFAPDGRTLSVNRAWSELWGVTLDQIAGYNVLADPQLEARGVAAYLRRAFAGETVEIPAIEYDPNQTIPGKTRHTDAVRWVSAVAYPLKDGAGHVREVVLVHEDITAQRRAEHALRGEEEKLRLLADTIPQLAWMAQPDGHIFWYNQRWYEYTGTTAQSMEGWGWQSVHDPAVLPDVLARWGASIATGEPFDMVFPLKGADGRFRPFLTRVNPLRAADGRVLYWFGTNTDISDIKRMEEALREADRRKDDFLATLAHELRNPLAPIVNALQLLKMPAADAKTVQRAREVMDRQLRHLVRLVDDLLDMSRIVRGKVELRRESVELGSVVARAVETAQQLIDARGHRLDISLAQGLRIDGDPVRLAQVIGNLVGNSARYTPPNGRISISAHASGNDALIRVEDNGMGIAPEMMPRIFDSFVQGAHSAVRAEGGLGIGLALVKSLVELHGGRVDAHSAGTGKGASFVVRLPLAEAAMHGADRAPPAALPGAVRRRVLVVDDNRDAADTLAGLLRLEAHEVTVAYDGAEALALAPRLLPEVVFLDLGMPGMDGYETVRRLRRLPGAQGARYVALTGWGQEEVRRRAAEAGFDHHMVKPPDLGALQAVMAAPLGAG